MPSFKSDGVELAYDDIAPPGHRDTVLLIHGFASNRYEGWRRTGWYSAFERRGSRVIALDMRGHGESGKPHDAQAYGRARLAADVIGLIDHLGVQGCTLLGYSMGAHVALNVALEAPDRLGKLICGGIGGRLLEPESPSPLAEALPAAMLAEDPETIEDPMARSFRHFADEQGEDLKALAAFLAARAAPFEAADLAGVRSPALVFAGARDELAGDPQALASALFDARAVVVPGCDHFSAIPHALTKGAVFDFQDGLLDEPEPDAWR
ncbi:MAG: alpha/beta hydrolase [Phenylobacterium sp.]|uniref:alpha/beta fold hydrolase n=1 Tax=Phenylobacterium sp. TaxID=1871053 RepID=UPI0027366A7E|nr:alpha/beta hydrolase [Phenylobacterium sp.]MDP3174063.1 alpha/beta hydrolase [Phenylobacterium sp.]